MVERLAKRLHSVYCEAIHTKSKLCPYMEYYIKDAIEILGQEYVFITIEEFTNLRNTQVQI